MPLITLTTKKGKSPQFIDTVLEAIHTALVANGVPETDRFHRVLELDDQHLRYDTQYPDLITPRSENFVLIEITLGIGRTVKIKKQITTSLVTKIQQQLNISAEDIMLIFIETRWENWSFGGGRFIHA